MLLSLLLLAAVPSPFDTEVLVEASPAQVYQAFTTLEGVKTFFAPGGKIELRAGGPYEIYFMPDAPAGSRGADICTVISFEANKKLSFTWNFPPSIPALRSAGALTQVTVELSAEGKRTRVKLRHDGWQEGADWEKGRAYFSHAWPVVLARLKHRFAIGALDWKHPFGAVSLEDLKWMAGSYRGSAERALHEEIWTHSEAGLLGAYRVSEGAKASFFELATIEAEDGELYLRMQMFGPGLSPSKRTAAKPLRLALHGVDGQSALFVGLDGEKGTELLYQLEKDALTVTLKRTKGEVEVVRMSRVAQL